MAATNEPDSEPTQPWDGASGGMPASPISDSGLEGLLGANAPVTRGGWQPPSPEELQARLPHYEVTELLGRGGMGAVYKGWQKSLERFVAIKILPPGLESGDVDFAARFKREAKAMAKLKHPGIIPVHDAGETADGLLYFVMDFVEGTDVQKLLAARGKLPPEEALPIASRVLDALAYAHQRGIIHRDIKPANIMLDTEGNVLVADFGLARSTAPDSTMLTVSHMAMGTPDFMAPESHLGMDHVDHRADLYAVGVMLYQMLSGKLPRGRFEPLSRAVPGLDKRLDGIVDRTLQNERDARYSSALELKSAIEPVLTRTMVKRRSAVPSTSPSQKKPPLLGGLAIAGAALGIAGWFLWDNDEEERPPLSASPTGDTAEVKLVEAKGQPSAAIASSSDGTAGKAAEARPAPSAASPQWQRVDFAGMGVSKVGTHSSRDGETLLLRVDEIWKVPAPGMRDGAIRATVRWDAETNLPRLLTRMADGQKHYKADLRPRGIGINLYDRGDKQLKGFPVAKAFQPGDSVVFQLASIGSRHFVWVNGQLLGSVEDASQTGPGALALQANNARYESVEWLPLDGLPEVEARKLIDLETP